jgi:hypothetical protein
MGLARRAEPLFVRLGLLDAIVVSVLLARPFGVHTGRPLCYAYVVFFVVAFVGCTRVLCAGQWTDSSSSDPWQAEKPGIGPGMLEG